jgi:hypothetical protein
MTYDINNLGKFENKFPHKIAGVIDDFGSTVKTEIKDFILQDRQEAYEEGRREGLDDLVNEIEKHEWFTEMNEDWDMIKEQINKLKQ